MLGDIEYIFYFVIFSNQCWYNIYFDYKIGLFVDSCYWYIFKQFFVYILLFINFYWLKDEWDGRGSGNYIEKWLIVLDFICIGIQIGNGNIVRQFECFKVIFGNGFFQVFLQVGMFGKICIGQFYFKKFE